MESRGDYKTALIVLVSVMAGVLLAGSGMLPVAQGLSEGRAGDVVCVVGEERNGVAPIILVATRDETLLAYEYSYANDQIELKSARTYQFDRRIREFNIDGITVEQVAREVTAPR